LVTKPEGKCPLGRPSCRWEDNIKKNCWVNIMTARGIGPWHELVMSCCEHGNEPCGSIQFRAYLDKDACEEGLLYAVRLPVTSRKILTVSGCSSWSRKFRSPTTGCCCHTATCNRWTDARYCGHRPDVYIDLSNIILVAQLVEELRYKSESRGFDPRWCHWNFLLTCCCCWFWWWGLSALQPWGLIVLSPAMEFRHSSPEALHTKRRERPLLAKDGTKAKEFS
jgi:hypothetical protein